VKHVTKEMNVGSKAQYGRRVEKAAARNWCNISGILVSSIGSKKGENVKCKRFFIHKENNDM
jgi:hypothetical protein